MPCPVWRSCCLTLESGGGAVVRRQGMLVRVSQPSRAVSCDSFMRRSIASQTTRGSLSDTLVGIPSKPGFIPSSNSPRIYWAVRLRCRVLAGRVRRGFCPYRGLAVPHDDHRESHGCRSEKGRCAQGPFRQGGHRPASGDSAGSGRGGTSASKVSSRRVQGSWIGM